uniref:Uncharacterized protein n=1 Tax=Rhizophora mucronata TaxID=61149 RepID=A0A2P2QED7_RHIMU
MKLSSFNNSPVNPSQTCYNSLTFTT